MRQIGIYGKGGIGKSTLAVHLSAAWALEERRILQVGCDPKKDSTRNLLGRRHPAPVLDLLRRDRMDTLPSERFLRKGFAGVSCVEAGGPEPGHGCAGRGIIKTFDVLDEAGVFDRDWDAVIYDVLGDVVCGGFAAPLRAGRATEIYIAVSGEPMALWAANNICRGVARYARSGPVRLGGLLPNLKDPEADLPLVRAVAERLGAPLLPAIQWDPAVRAAEREGRSVLEDAPDCLAAGSFRWLAKAVWENTERVVPTPIDDDELDALLRI